MERIAKTLENITENPVVSTALDKSKDIDGTINEVKMMWSVDLEGRRPAPTYIDNSEKLNISDFDMFTFMNALADRKAVINLPSYEGMAPKTMKADERVVSKSNRHGSVRGLSPNKEVHSFSVKIKDYNVVKTLEDGSEIVGAPRNFALVDYEGKMHNGWKSIEFKPNADENDFLENKELWQGNTVYFKNFVHPNLAFALYGSRYIATKALANRIEDEARFYRALAKDLREEGICLGHGSKNMESQLVLPEGYSESIKVPNLEVKLLMPEAKGGYPITGENELGGQRVYGDMPKSRETKREVLRYSENRAKHLSHKVGSQINASVRAVELAYFLNGFVGGKREYGNEKQPGWDVPSWERGYKETERSRIEWNAMKLNNETTLLYRIRKTSVPVKA